MSNIENFLFGREIRFDKDEGPIALQQAKVIEALETLRLKYKIERKTAWGTAEPVWDISVYKS